MCKDINKTSLLRWMEHIGRSLFSLFVFTQAVLFARYPSIYLDNDLWNLLILLALPTLIAALIVIFMPSEQEVKWLWLVWSFYVIFLLTPMVALIFGVLRKELDSEQFFGPNILRMIICGAPVIAICLFTTAKDARKNGDLVVQLCGGIALDLFDDIEVLAVILPHKESPVHLPNSLEISIIVCVCLSFLLSPLEIAENKLIKYNPGHKPRKRVYLCRLILQMLLVNAALLVIRLVVWLKYKNDASIFIAKNMVIIVIAILNIARLRCGFDKD